MRQETMRLVNPFKPTAGAEPPVLIGREKVVEDFTDALEEGVGAPGRLVRITGPRGSGKTVLLTELGDVARSAGWTVVDETAGEGMCAAICRTLGGTSGVGAATTKASAELNVFVVKAQVGAEKSPEDQTLREVLTEAAGKLTKKGKGLLITVDEIQDANADDVRSIASAVQHLIRERVNVAFVFAGLTTGVLDLINGKALTFLRRAKAEELAAIPLDEVAGALRATIEASSFAIGDDALARMAQATAGYAYLIQLVGYHVWRAAKAHAETSRTVSDEDVRSGSDAAMAAYRDAVLEPAIAKLSRRALEYAIVMADDDGPSSTGEVAQRLGVPASSLTSPRRALIKAQVIEPMARGFVDFSIPYMRPYLRDCADELLARFGVVRA